MNVLLLNGSPHAAGSTYTALETVAESLRAEGIDTEIIHVGHLAVRGCVACNRCVQLGRCIFDDIVNELAEKFEQADGLVIGSPVYYASPNATLLALLDRLFNSSSFDKTMKVGAAVVSARRGGNTASYDVLNKYFGISNMPIVSSQYWNQIHGNNATEAIQDLEGIDTMSILGRNMAFLLKSIELGKRQYGVPGVLPRRRTNFIR